MRFGLHTHLVEEVIEYARNGELFVGPYRGDTSSMLIETDFAKAQERAWTQHPDGDYAIWSDLKEGVKSEVLEKRYQLVGFDAIDNELIKLADELGGILKKRLRRGPYEDLTDEVLADFYDCAYKRAVFGSEPHFFETLYACYRAGGWPCGWKGDYPTGTLVVYLWS